MSEVKLYLGDCLEILPQLEAKSIDAIITDLPYGTTACTWDEIIPFEPMWAQVKRLLKPRGVFVTTASQPFTSKLVMSNLEWFRYEWIWDKVNKYTDFMNASHRPLKRHENILVFSPNGHTYNPQMSKVPAYKSRKSQPGKVEFTHAGVGQINYGQWINEINPCSILQIASHSTIASNHPTQKIVILYEYLIRTYTNEGDIVLDFCFGSGTTGVACIQTGRNFIGIEIDPKYFAIAEKRIAEAQMQLRMEI